MSLLKAHSRQGRKYFGRGLSNRIAPPDFRIDERKTAQGESGIEFRHAGIKAQPFRIVRADIAVVAHGADGGGKFGVARGDQATLAGNQKLRRRERKYFCISERTDGLPAIGAAESVG